MNIIGTIVGVAIAIAMIIANIAMTIEILSYSLRVITSPKGMMAIFVFYVAIYIYIIAKDIQNKGGAVLLKSFFCGTDNLGKFFWIYVIGYNVISRIPYDYISSISEQHEVTIFYLNTAIYMILTCGLMMSTIKYKGFILWKFLTGAYALFILFATCSSMYIVQKDGCISMFENEQSSEVAASTDIKKQLQSMMKIIEALE